MATIPSNFFHPARLSGMDLFRTGDPRLAAAVGNDVRAALTSPEIQELLKAKGVPQSYVMQMLDVPETEEGVVNFQQQLRPRSGGIGDIGTRVGEGLANLTERFGLDNPLLSLFGAGVESEATKIQPFEPLPNEGTTLPVLGKVDPVALGAELAAFLIPGTIAVRAGAAAVGATGLAAAAPNTAAALGFALGGGLLEGGRQGIRHLTKDEPIDPASIAMEAAVFGAGGIPMPGGFLGRRLLAGAASGTAAAVLPPLLGREFDPGRAASETAFGLVFGNPRIGKPKAPIKSSARRAVAALGGEPITTAPRSIADQLQAASEVTNNTLRTQMEKARPLTDTPLAVRTGAEVGPNPTVAIRTGAEVPMTSKVPDIPQGTAVAERIMNAPNPKLEAQKMKLRADATRALAKQPLEELQALSNTMDLDPDIAVLIRDAIAEKTGRTVISVDAPAKAVVMPVKEEGVYFHPEADQFVAHRLAEKRPTATPFGAGKADPQYVADAVVHKALTYTEEGLHPRVARQALKEMSPEARLQLAITVEDMKETIKQERMAKGQRALEDAKLHKAAAERLDIQYDSENGVTFTPNTRASTPDHTSLRQMMIEDNFLDGARAQKDAAIVRAAGDLATPEMKANAEAKLQEIEAKGKALAEGETLEGPVTFAMARKVLDENIDGMTPAQAKRWLDSTLPKDLQHLMPELQAELKRKLRHKAKVDKVKKQPVEVQERINRDPDSPMHINITGGQQGIPTTGPRTSTGISFRDVQAKAHAAGVDLKPTDTGFTMTIRGQEVSVPNLKAADQMMDDIAAIVAGDAQPMSTYKKEELTHLEERLAKLTPFGRDKVGAEMAQVEDRIARLKRGDRETLPSHELMRTADARGREGAPTNLPDQELGNLLKSLEAESDQLKNAGRTEEGLEVAGRAAALWEERVRRLQSNSKPPTAIRTGSEVSNAPTKAITTAAEVTPAMEAKIRAAKHKVQNPTKHVVEAAAHRKLTTVDHVGNGKYRTVNRKTGEVATHGDIKEVGDYVNAIETPVSVELLPVGEKYVSAGGMTPVGGSGSSGRVPLFDMPESNAVSFPGPVSKMFGTKGELMKKIQDATGVPVWDEVWEPLMKAANTRDRYNTLVRRDLNKAMAGIKPGRSRVVQDLMIAGKARGRMIDELQATPREVKAAANLRKWYGEVLELDLKQLDEFFDEAIPQFREVSGDPMRALRNDNTFPGSLSEIADDILTGKVDLSEPNARVLAGDILQSLGRSRYLKPSVARATQIQKLLSSLQRKKGISPEVRKNLATTHEVVSDFVDSMVNGAGGANRGASTAAVLGPMFDALKKTGLIERGGPTAHEIDVWSQEMSSFVSGAALSLRPALAVRNFFQRALAANKVGFDTLFDAQRMALTPEGLKLINDSGVIPGRVTFFMEDVNAMLAAADEPGLIAKTKRGVLKAQDTGLWLYRKADHGNRGVSFLAGYLSVKEHAKLLAEGNLDEFLLRTGMANESTTVLNRVLKPLQEVDAKGWDSAVEKAAKEYGIRVAEDSQFVYNPSNAPGWMQSIPGRFAGQFGIWPVAYTEWAFRNVGGLSGSARTSLQSAAGNRFLIHHLSMVAAIAAAGLVLGVDTSGYNRANPLDFAGGPVFQAARDMASITLQTGGEFNQLLAQRNLERFVTTFSVPFGGAVQDINQAMDEKGAVQAMLTAMGFTLREDGSILN